MATLKQIQFKRSKTAGQRPAASVLAEGELAINLKDKTIFTKDDSGSVIELGLKYGGTIDGSLTVNGNIIGNLTGNAATATKLKTARKINGISFDGSKDITLTPSDINVNSTTFIKNNGELPVDANLDEYGPVEEYLGVWSKATSTNAQPANKFPEENAVGVLEVFVAGQFAGTQRYTTMFGVVYTRCLTAAWDATAPKWGPWQQVGNVTPATFYDGNLNDFKTPGLYNILGTDKVTNRPVAEGVPIEMTALLEVKQRASGAAIFQRFTTAGTGSTTRGRVFERAMTNNIWGNWHEVYTSYSLPITLGMGGIKAQLAELDWQTFDFVPGSMFSVPLNKIKNMPANMNWGTIDGNLVMFSVGPSEHTSTGRTVQVWRGTVSQTNYRYFVVRVFGNSGNRTCTVRRVVLEDGRHKWTAQQDFNGAVNFGAPTNFNSTVNLNNTTTFKTEVKFRSLNAFKMYGGKFGAIFRNDGESLYILSTDEDDQDGNFNTNRPFRYELRTGDVTLGGTSGANVLKLKRDSLTAFFGGDINIKGLMTFDAGRLGSRDYFKFNHWGDSNNARDNIIQLEDSKGVHFSTERTLATGAIKTKFFGEVESDGRLIIKRPGDSIVLSAPASNSLHIRGDVDGTNNWYIGKGGDDNGLAFYSYATNAGVYITNAGDITLSPKGVEMAHVNNVRLYVHGERWTASQPGDWGNQWRVEAPIFVDHGYVGSDSYYPIIKGRSVVTNQGYVTAVDLGIRRIPNNWGQAIIRVGSAEASPDAGHPNAVFEFHYDGFFYAPGNGSFNDVYIRSDGRLKINKKELENGAVEKVCRLKVYTYDKVKSIKDRSVIKHEVGIIAQDLEKELPEAVSKVEVDGSDVLTISNSAVNALLIKAIQEMSEEIKELKTPFFTKIARKISNYFKF